MGLSHWTKDFLGEMNIADERKSVFKLVRPVTAFSNNNIIQVAKHWSHLYFRSSWIHAFHDNRDDVQQHMQPLGHLWPAYSRRRVLPLDHRVVCPVQRLFPLTWQLQICGLYCLDRSRSGCFGRHSRTCCSLWLSRIRSGCPWGTLSRRQSWQWELS